MSASLNSTRKQGGRASRLPLVQQFTANFRSFPIVDDPLRGKDLLPIRASKEEYFLDDVVRLSTAATMFNGGIPGGRQDPLEELQRSTLEVVPELGFKARVVTKSHPMLVTTGHELRSVYFPYLRRFAATRSCLDDVPSKIDFVKPRGPPVVVFNADLKKATDGLNHRVVASFCEAAGIPATLVYSGLTVDGTPVVRGIFMGLPMSWTILSVIHYSVAFAVDIYRNFRIKGDDLIALWTVEQVSLYRELMAACGCSVNETKTFISFNKGFFCERLFVGRWRGRHLRLYLQQTPTVRSFFPDREASGLALALSPIPAHMNRAFNRTVQLKFPKLLSLAKSFRLNPYLPISLGGAGLLRPEPDWVVRNPNDQRYIQSVFSGLPLLNTVYPLRPVAGSFVDHLNKLCGKIRYLPPGAGPTCPHVKGALRLLYSASTLADAFRGRLPRRTRNRDLYKGIYNLKRKVKGVPREITYSRAQELVSQLAPYRRTVDCSLCAAASMPGAYPQ